MKERGILFSTPMVRALLAGTKTQTRRAVKPQGSRMDREILPDGVTVGWRTDVRHAGGTTTIVMSPYGVPSDRLWVRETWRADKAWDGVGPMIIPRGSSIWFAAGGEKNVVSAADRPGKTRVSIFMPRWASRLTLEVTEVRVQRLQDISEEDARAEGVAADKTTGLAPIRATSVYAELWDSINGAGSWASNPWVWAISFRRLP